MVRLLRVRRLLLVASALVAALLLAELLTLTWLHWFASDADFRVYASDGELQARYGDFERFAVHRHLGFALKPGYERGANRHNRLGFRGDELTIEKPDGVVRIACCGGSTTYGEGVTDYHMSMPALLEIGLRAEGHGLQVINAGCPGWTTLETLINFESRVLELAPDWVVVYHGINDVLARMVWPHAAYRADLSGWITRDGYTIGTSPLEGSALARVIMVRCGALESHGSLLRLFGDVPPTSYTFEFRAQRLADTYPSGRFREVPIEQMIAENAPVFFERNLRSLLAVAATHGVRAVLCTFAFSREFPNRPNIGLPAVQAAIEHANELIRRIGRETDTPVIDMAAELTEAVLFVDGEHCNRDGNVRRAQLLGAFFRSRLR